MTSEDIRKLIGQEEGAELEYKSAKGGFPESFWETFSAFANTHGGTIVFGIKEKDGKLIPDGLDERQIAKYKKTFALREALANTLIHCNYAQRGNILVVGRRESITMRNPGCMLISLADFYAGSHSICRNPTLQKLFMFLGNGEKAGSGADIIKKGWSDNHWPAPELSERMQPDETMMTLTIETKSNETSQETSQESAITSQEADSPSLKTSQKIIELIKKDKHVTTQEMANILGVDRRNIARNIKKLQEQCALVRIGATKNGYWELP